MYVIENTYLYVFQGNYQLDSNLENDFFCVIFVEPNKILSQLYLKKGILLQRIIAVSRLMFLVHSEKYFKN